jgi:hypothetical protein
MRFLSHVVRNRIAECNYQTLTVVRTWRASLLPQKLTRDCGPVPISPPGVSANANINLGLYRRYNVSPVRNLTDMVPQFRTGGTMDYKQSGQQYVDFGNFNYGSYSISVGFDPVQTRSMAEAYSLYSRHDFDQPRDRDQIEAGIRYAQCRLEQ